jgi:integrase
MKILFMNGAEIVMVSKLMGHNSLKTTEIYTHVRTKNIQQIKSPFDDLKKHILTKSDLTSHIHLTYIQLA